MILDGKPEHWPKMLEGPADESEQGAVRALATVRSLIVEHHRVTHDGDWRLSFAQSARIENVVGGLLADIQAEMKYCRSLMHADGQLRERIAELKEALAESKRPFSAQMEMQNRRIIALNAELDMYRRQEKK